MQRAFSAERAITGWALISSSQYSIIPLTCLIFEGFQISRLEPLQTMSWLCSSDQMTSLPSPSPRMSERRQWEFWGRVGYLNPSMNGDLFIINLKQISIQQLLLRLRQHFSRMIRPSKQRVRESSTQNYRRSKVSYQSIISKKSSQDKVRAIRNQQTFEDIQKTSATLIKPSLNTKKISADLTSTCWCLYDQQSDDFIGFRETQQREVASLTKIMTTILSLNLIDRYSLDKQIAIRISRSASILNGTTANLKYGKWVRLEDLLYGAMLPSGNDAAFLLAEVLGLLLFYERMKPEDKEYIDIESIDITLYENTIPFVNRFLKEMNSLAKKLKLHKTTFANPHGLSNILNFSTAKDMIELCKYACKNKDFTTIMNTQVYECDFFDDDFESINETKVWKNTNKLLKKGWEGIKTGQTPAAGNCLASLREGVYIIVLNSCNLEARFTDTQMLFKWYKVNKLSEEVKR